MGYPNAPCEPECTLDNMMTSWSVTASMGSAYSATIQVVDPCNMFTCGGISDHILRPIYVMMDSQVVTNQDLDLACHNQNARWIWGVVTNVKKTFNDSSREAEITVGSFSARLAEKVINSHHKNEPAQTVLNELATIYGHLPDGYYDFSDTDMTEISCPVSGNSLIQEMHLIAQCGGSDLFVNEHGVLVTRAWFDPAAPADFTIPKEFVISVERPDVDFAIPTRIMVRGSYYSSLEKGVQDLGGSSNGGGGTGSTPRDRQIYCVHNPFEDSDFNFVLNNLSGSRADLRNATLELDNGQVVDYTMRMGTSPGQLSVKINGPGGAYLGSGDHEIGMRVMGRIRDPRELFPNFNGRGILGTGIFDPNQYVSMLSYLIRNGYIGVSSTSSASGGGQGQSGKEKDVPDLLRHEIVVDDAGLQSSLGILTEELDNRYVKSKERLFEIGVHRLQEAKMNRQQWSINLVYYPCISLGDKVTVELPETLEAGTCTVTGRVVQLRTDYSNEPKANTTIVIIPDSEVGDTEYYTPNLLEDPDLLGYGERWDFVSAGDADVFIYGGEAVIGSSADDLASLTYAHEGATIGRNYEIKFTLLQEEGFFIRLQIVGTNNGEIGTYTFHQGGDFVIPFTSNDTELEFIWFCEAGVRTWRVSKPSLHAYITG